MIVNGDDGNTDDIRYGDEADDATYDDDSFARATLPSTKCAPPKAYTIRDETKCCAATPPHRIDN